MLTTEVTLSSILTIQLHVVCLSFEILFTKILVFFNMWVFVRTGTNFAHLATFQTIEFKDRPILKTLDIFVCPTSENKAFFTKHSILQLLFTKNENMISFISMCQRSCLQHRTWGEMKVQVQRIHWEIRLKDDE